MTGKITPAGPRPSPAKMLSEMSNTTTLAWIFVALLIHVAVFGATSISYLRAAFDPSAAEAPSVEAEARPVQPAPAAVPVAGPDLPPAKPKTPAPATKGDLPDEAKMLEAHKDSPVVKSITETAKPSELPKGPSHNALELDSLDSK